MRKEKTAAITADFALSLIDLIPDVIPVLGYLEDIILSPGEEEQAAY